jgi:hypothetical protein
MNRQSINRISAIAPIVMSIAAFLLVIFAVATGWERNLRDEGAAAHIFQLLIVLQGPFILAYLATADRARWPRAARSIALQVMAIVLAFAPVAIFRL